jgi:hypothetical protein
MNKTKLKITLEGLAILTFGTSIAVGTYMNFCSAFEAGKQKYHSTNSFAINTNTNNECVTNPSATSATSDLYTIIKPIDEEGDTPFRDE